MPAIIGDDPLIVLSIATNRRDSTKDMAAPRTIQFMKNIVVERESVRICFIDERVMGSRTFTSLANGGRAKYAEGRAMKSVRTDVRYIGLKLLYHWIKQPMKKLPNPYVRAPHKRT